MEVKINREIRNYTEAMFFGLSMRQFFFSAVALGVAVLLYFLLKPYVGTETVSWMCILGAAPFAALGFITYHGMTAEQFLWTWLRSELLEALEKGLKVVIISDESFRLDGAICYGTVKQNEQIRLIADSHTVLTGDLEDEDNSTCLYSCKRNLVDLFKDALKNEIQLIKLQKGKR